VYSVLLSVAFGLLLGGASWGMDMFGAVGSLVVALGGFAAGQIAGGLFVQRKVKTGMEQVQQVLVEAKKTMEAKSRRWMTRPPDSVKSAQAEMAAEQRKYVLLALERTEALHRFDRWVPMMRRQIATAQFQLFWMIREWRKVDDLMDKALFLDPTMSAMKMARLHMKGEPLETIEKVYAKALRRLRYNQNVLVAATWSWILVQKGEVDRAFKALNEALKNSDDATLKANREALANNRVAHFNNSGIGETWYALGLEEPKVKMQRQRMQWR